MLEYSGPRSVLDEHENSLVKLYTLSPPQRTTTNRSTNFKLADQLTAKARKHPPEAVACDREDYMVKRADKNKLDRKGCYFAEPPCYSWRYAHWRDGCTSSDRHLICLQVSGTTLRVVREADASERSRLRAIIVTTRIELKHVYAKLLRLDQDFQTLFIAIMRALVLCHMPSSSSITQGFLLLY